MRIKALTTFLDGADRFEKDDERTVDDARGARLVGNGWAADLAGQVMTGDSPVGATDLAIDNSVIGQEARHG